MRRGDFASFEKGFRYLAAFYRRDFEILEPTAVSLIQIWLSESVRFDHLQSCVPSVRSTKESKLYTTGQLYAILSELRERLRECDGRICC